MEKQKLISTRTIKGFSIQDMADRLNMNDYSYRRRENGHTKISIKEWNKITEILEVNLEDIFENDNAMISINNGDGQNNNFSQKIEYYNIPKEMIEIQQEYINQLKEQLENLKQENEKLKTKII